MEIDPVLINAATDVVTQQFSVSSASVTTIALEDSSRIAIRFNGVQQLSASNGPLIIGNNPKPTSERLFELQNRGDYQEFLLRDYGSLVGRAWFATSQIGTATLTVAITRLSRPEMLTWERQSSLQAQLSALSRSVSGLSTCLEKVDSLLNEYRSAIASRNFWQQARRG